MLATGFVWCCIAILAFKVLGALPWLLLGAGVVKLVERLFIWLD
jgi:uncharacterized membrane protein YuzA (DUF378 family)